MSVVRTFRTYDYKGTDGQGHELTGPWGYTLQRTYGVHMYIHGILR